MSVGPTSVFDLSVIATETLSSGVDLGGAYADYSVVVPTMPSATTITFLGSETLAGTYRTIYIKPTAAAASVPVQVASTVNNAIVGVDIKSRYLKLECASAPTTTIGYQLICNNS